MAQKIWTIAAAALAIVAAGANANAASGFPEFAGLYQSASLVAPDTSGLAMEHREVITPPSDIDRDMAIKPPSTGARMPVIAPPELPGSKFGIER